MLKDNINDVRKARHKESQEDFTPTDITSLLAEGSDDMIYDFSKTILDPSCGICYILVECLQRRLTKCSTESDIIKAVSTLYGTELHQDNVAEGRENMLAEIKENAAEKGIALSEETIEKIKAILNHNIACTDSFAWNYTQWKPLAASTEKLF